MKVNLTLEGSEEPIKKILSLIELLRYNGIVGHSARFYINWDGDGADRIRVEPKEVLVKEKFSCGELKYISEFEKYIQED